MKLLFSFYHLHLPLFLMFVCLCVRSEVHEPPPVPVTSAAYRDILGSLAAASQPASARSRLSQHQQHQQQQQQQQQTARRTTTPARTASQTPRSRSAPRAGAASAAAASRAAFLQQQQQQQMENERRGRAVTPTAARRLSSTSPGRRVEERLLAEGEMMYPLLFLFLLQVVMACSPRLCLCARRRARREALQAEYSARVTHPRRTVITEDKWYRSHVCVLSVCCL